MLSVPGVLSFGPVANSHVHNAQCAEHSIHDRIRNMGQGIYREPNILKLILSNSGEDRRWLGKTEC